MIGQDLASKVLERGLAVSSLRQRITAHNLANVTTPGFKRARVEFEEQMQQALASGQTPDRVQPKVVEETKIMGRPDGNNVDIELEMSQMAMNQIWHGALVRQLSDHFSRLRMVIRDGRG